MLVFEQAEDNLTRRYKRIETVEQFFRIKGMRDEGLTISKIKAILNQTK